MVESFQQTVFDYYGQHQRILPWRIPDAQGRFDPYKIMISEVMLQQTQVPRVIEKYQQFLEVFPTVHALSEAPLQDVLQVWQGLGYNRRGRFLREAAKMVVVDYGGIMPMTVADLVRLPGIGHNTACAILVYASNQPLVFIETNIRSVYLHHFFANQEKIADTEIMVLVGQTLYRENPRDWYWALMDYGTYIKKNFSNPNTRSKHYAKQSTFKGSKREVRGMVLRALTERPFDIAELRTKIPDARLDDVLQDLTRENLVRCTNTTYTVAS